MKASLVAYDVRKLQKNSKNKNIEYIKGYPKWQSTQIWLLEFLGINEFSKWKFSNNKEWLCILKELVLDVNEL